MIMSKKANSKQATNKKATSKQADVNVTNYLRELIVARDVGALSLSNEEIAKEVKQHFPASAVSPQYVAKSRYAILGKQKRT
jgi:hypothetical protein